MWWKKVCARRNNIDIEFLRAGVNKWIHLHKANEQIEEFHPVIRPLLLLTARCEHFNPPASHHHVTCLAHELSEEQLDPNGDVLSCLKSGNYLLFLYFPVMHDLKNWTFAQVQGSSQVHFFLNARNIFSTVFFQPGKRIQVWWVGSKRWAWSEWRTYGKERACMSVCWCG